MDLAKIQLFWKGFFSFSSQAPGCPHRPRHRLWPNLGLTPYSSKLRLIFEAAEQTRAVYLFDEFDSIGYTRDATGDVGEMRRVLNVSPRSVPRPRVG